MKHIINTLIITAASIASFSCQMKEDTGLLMNERITLELSSSLTKADHTSTEAHVNHLDIFIF